MRGTATAAPRPLRLVALACARGRDASGLLALPDQPSPLNHASLIYTGVTRARSRATVCADEALLAAGLRIWPERRSGLAEALRAGAR